MKLDNIKMYAFLLFLVSCIKLILNFFFKAEIGTGHFLTGGGGEVVVVKIIFVPFRGLNTF